MKRDGEGGGKRADGTYSRGWRKLTEIVVPPLVNSLVKQDWHGHENIRNIPADSGLILAINHLSYADVLPICLFTYRSGRYPVFLAKSSLFEIKGLGAVMRGTGQLPVYRGQADAALVLRDAEKGLKSGACVIFYPEATATRDPNLWPMVAKTGVARLALSTGVPVIPVAQWGAQHILPYGSARPHLFPRTTVQIVAAAGRPVRVRGPAAGLACAPRGHRQDHEGHHRPAGRHPRRDPARHAVPPGGRAQEGQAGGQGNAGQCHYASPHRL